MTQTYNLGDIVRIKGFRNTSLYEVIGKYSEKETESNLYYVTRDQAVTEQILPADLFTLVCRAENREDVNFQGA